jgi:hypothetical protein
VGEESALVAFEGKGIAKIRKHKTRRSTSIELGMSQDDLMNIWERTNEDYSTSTRGDRILHTAFGYGVVMA